MKQHNDGSELIVPGDYLETLKNCKGYYRCPKVDGAFVGPLVGYAGTYKGTDNKERFLVGSEYFNFSRADQYPAVLTYFAKGMVQKLSKRGELNQTVILGAPWAGVKFSQEVARITGCRHIFAEKETVMLGNHCDERPIERFVLGRYEVNPGDRVVIGEELVNNFSSTQKLIDLVIGAGGEVVGIICAVNRSFPTRSQYFRIPVISVIEAETPQYMQNDPVVCDLVKAGNVIWKPKVNHWPELQKIMAEYGIA